jgi:hypothetical protein
MLFTRAQGVSGALGLAVLMAACSGGGGTGVTQALPQTPAAQAGAPGDSAAAGGVVQPGAGTSSSTTTSTLADSTFSGTIDAVWSGGFQIKSSSCGYLTIYTSSTTTWSPSGTKAADGEYATVAGSGSCGTHVTATSVTIGSATTTSYATTTTVMRHVMTQDFLGTATEAEYCSKYAPYLTIDFPKTDTYAQWHACGIKVGAYANVGQPNSSDSSGTDKTWTAITGAYSGVRATNSSGAYVIATRSGYLPDPHHSGASGYLQWVMNAVRAYTYGYADPGIMPDVTFWDDWNDVYGVNSMPSDWSSQSDWTSHWMSAFSNVNTYGSAVIVNTLAVAPVGGLLTNAIKGGEFEGCYANADHWTNTENIEIATQDYGKQFWCNADEYFATLPATDYAARMFAYASFLLTYKPTLAVWHEQMATYSGFHVFPESGIVALNPAVTPSTVTSLLVGGVYERRYGACYYRGSSIGACMVVVNPSGFTQSVNSAGYNHHVVLSGTDVLDGGTLSVSGSKIYALGAYSGAILTP